MNFSHSAGQAKFKEGTRKKLDKEQWRKTTATEI